MSRELEALSTRELERGITSGRFDPEHKLEAERILGERYSEPDRTIGRWTLIFSAVAAVAGVVAAVASPLALR